MSPEPTNKHRIDEDAFLFDYFRFASRVSGFAAVANYNLFQNLKSGVEQKAVFVAQQIVLLNAYEDFAIFLNALNKSKGGTSIVETMARGEKHFTEFPKSLKNLERPAEFLEWIGIDEKQLIKKMREKSGNSRRMIEKITKKRVCDLIDGVKRCSKHKIERNTVYNKAKHGKPILSTDPDQIFKNGEIGKAIHFIDYKKKGRELKSQTIPFSVEQFETITKNIIRISDASRDLVLFLVAQFHPNILDMIEREISHQTDLRKVTPRLWL